MQENNKNIDEFLENQDWKFRDDLVSKDSKDAVAIELLMAPFNGVIIRYQEVRIDPPNPTKMILEQDNAPRLMFKYRFVKIPDDKSEAGLRKNPKFNEFVGLILNQLILMVTDADTGKIDTSESIKE